MLVIWFQQFINFGKLWLLRLRAIASKFIKVGLEEGGMASAKFESELLHDTFYFLDFRCNFSYSIELEVTINYRLGFIKIGFSKALLFYWQ